MRTSIRFASLFTVLAAFACGNPVNAQMPPPKPEPVIVQIKETVRLKTDLTFLEDSSLTSGTTFGGNLKAISGCFIFKDEVRVDLSVQDFLKGSKLDKCIYFPEGTKLPAGTEIAPGSCITIDKTSKLPRPMITVGLKKIEPGDYAKLSTEDVAIDGIVQKAKASKFQADAVNAKNTADAAMATLALQEEKIKILTDAYNKMVQCQTLNGEAMKSLAQDLATAKDDAAQAKAKAYQLTQAQGQVQADIAQAKAEALLQAKAYTDNTVQPLVNQLNSAEAKLLAIAEKLKAAPATPAPAPAAPSSSTTTTNNLYFFGDRVPVGTCWTNAGNGYWRYTQN